MREGTTFTGRLIGETTVGELQAIVPEISGEAHITGEHTFLVDEHDPLAELPDAIQKQNVKLAILAVPAEQAQEVAVRVVRNWVTGTIETSTRRFAWITRYISRATRSGAIGKRITCVR